MEFDNVTLAGVDVYYPHNKVKNSFYIEQFKNQGLDWISARHVMKHLGREIRYISNNYEDNTLSLGIEAAKRVLNGTGISSSTVDAIVFATDTPEYTYPSNAIKVHHAIEARNAHLVYDVNANCAGMLIAMDQVSRMMRGNSRINCALVIGSVHASCIANPDDIYFYPNFSDGSAAVILQSERGEKQRGVIAAHYYTDSKEHDNMVYPGCGLSRLHSEDISNHDKKLRFAIGQPSSAISKEWERLIRELLSQNDLRPEDIDFYCFSQFSKRENEVTLQNLGVSPDRQLFVGDQYGYTGVASPFYSLKIAWEGGRVKNGCRVVFVSVGAGQIHCSILYQF